MKGFTTLPSGWFETKVSYEYEVTLGKMIQSVPTDKSNIPCQYHKSATIQDGKLLEPAQGMYASADEIANLQIQKGDLLVCEGGDIGRSAIVDTDPETPVIFQNSAHRVRSTGNYSVKWLYYVLRFFKDSGLINVEISGTNTISHFTNEIFRSMVIPFPPVDLSNKYIDFLDCKIEKINSAIQNRQKRLEALTSYRKSLITRAVTKGVDQKGFDPVSYVPFSAIFSLRRGLNITRENYQEEGVPCLSYGDVHSRYLGFVDAEINPLPKVSESFMLTNPQCLLKTGEFVFADTSEDYTGSGNCSCVMNSGDGIFAGYHTTVASPTKRDICSHYYGYYFLSDDFRNQIRKEVKGVKVFSITNTILNHTRVLFPPLKDQEEIARFLDVKCSTISKIQQKIYKEIDILTEYRSSLISAAVTGQLAIDVEATK